MTPEVQCAMDEDHATLNYADLVKGASEFVVWVVLGDGSALTQDVSRAVLGSGTWLPLPSSGTQNEPVRLMLRRSTTSTSWKFKLASVSLSVLYARRVNVEVYDFQGQLNAEHAVRSVSSAIY